MKSFTQILQKYHWLAYPLFALKILIFYWVTDMLDMLVVIEVPLLTFLFLVTVYEVFSFKESRIRRIGFITVYGLITLVFLANAAYSSYFGRYISINQLYQIGSLAQIASDGNVVGETVSPLCLLTLLDYPLVILCYLGRNRGRKGMVDELLSVLNSPDKKKGKCFLSFLTVVFHTALYTLAICCLYYYGANPENLRSVQKINHIEIFTYHTSDAIFHVKGRLNAGKVDEEKLQQAVRENVPASEGSYLKGLARGKNLILIQTESLNDFVIGAKYRGEEITPNLNKLLKTDTFYFDQFYSTTGVGNTADAEFSVLNGLYGNDVRECYRKYVDNTFNGLPWMLREEGYEAMAFHGYIKTFWNRCEAYKNQGFSHFYSEEELEMTQKSGFGLTDKELFRQSVDILSKKKQPFFAFMITLTNHIPYDLDPSLASLSLAPEDINTTFGRYLQTVRYTDEAFGDLIDYLKEKDLYEDTMIVIYGDHQGMNIETPAVRLSMTRFLGRDYNYDEMLKVPLIIHIPGMEKSKTLHTVGGEVDIMPTIANLMDLDPGHPYVFGHDLLNAREGFLAQVSYVGKGSYISGQEKCIFNIGKDGSVEKGSRISIYDGSRMEPDVAASRKGSERSLALIDTCMQVLDANLINKYVKH